MFKIESYITPILLSYVDKYVKDFKPADAQVSLWGGGVVLHNLVLKTDVVQQEVPLPFTLVSGRIHELLIQVPWTKIMSEPIVVTIDTIECILNQRPPNEQQKTEAPSGATQVVEAPPGYMQALVRRIVSNIAIRIHHLIVKYVQDDIVLSLNVKHLSINSTGPNWDPAFADIEPSNPAIRRLITLDDLTLCLDNTDSDGKIRFYQDPLLYRCGLEFRVLAKLVSANTRRASSFDVQMSTTKIAWGVTSDQLVLLLRLFKERAQAENETPSPSSATKKASVDGASAVAMPAAPSAPGTSNTTDPSRRESWSDWAWSWKSSNRGKEEATLAACPTPIAFTAFLDEVSLVIKVLETDANSRKRSRSLLEVTAAFTAIRCSVCVPTLLRAKLGIRYLMIKSIGKCTCGHLDLNSAFDEPTIYLTGKQEIDEDWKWPLDKDEKDKEEVEVAEVAEEVVEKKKPPGPDTIPEETEAQASGAEQPPTVEEIAPESKETEEVAKSIFDNRKSKNSADFTDIVFVERIEDIPDTVENEFWKKTSPVVYLDFKHERSPPNHLSNPYENPPKDFEYSDWAEHCNIRIKVKPLNLRICMGLIHRLEFIKKIFDAVPPPPLEPMRVLTVEENEALNQNLPQRRIHVEIEDFRINIHPWDHSTVEKPVKEQLLLQIELPKANIVITAPLYAQRVCSAAGQLPEDQGVLWRGCRMHTTAALNNIIVSVCSPSNESSKPCGRINLRFVTHILLYPEYFEKKRSVRLSYAVKINEVNLSGSSARLHAAAQVISSLLNEKLSLALRHTTLARDALADEDLVALDLTAEELTGRGYRAKQVNTHIITLKSLRATVFQSIPNKEMQQAWLFSGPDVPTSSSYIRLAIQVCDDVFPGSIDFVGLWTEPTALAIDPLLASWLSYKPTLKSYNESNPQYVKNLSAISVVPKKQTTPTSSSGRGLTRSGTASAEVHNIARSRSVDSSSEPSEKKDAVTSPPAEPKKPEEPWWMGKNLLNLHERLKKVLICVELGLALIYVPTKTATAVGCETVRVAMEQHTTSCQSVIVYSLGRWSLHTNHVTKQLWHVINHEGPTYISVKEGEGANEKQENSFPWNMLLGDVSCYALEAPGTHFMKTDLSSSLKSQLKETSQVQGHTILELVSTNVALTVVTKTLQHKMVVKTADTSKQTSKVDKRDAKLRYFTAGTDFRPSTFVEFLRGPTRRKKDNATQSSPLEETTENVTGQPIQKVVDGPIVSLGFNVHADTPPVVFRFEYHQVRLVSLSLHCISHIIALWKQNPMDVPRRGPSGASASKQLLRSDMEEDFMSESDRVSEDRLMTIFQLNRDIPDTIKAFFWFQWVISRATAVVTIDKMKLALDMDDVSVSIDLQEHYNQLKIKIDSIFIKNFEQAEDGSWVPGPFNGRVLDAREATTALDEGHFVAVTITAARISTLPESWKEELHPKLLEHQSTNDTMWEVYAVLASLEVVLVPEVMNNIILLNKSISIDKSCASFSEKEKPISTFDLPYCYLSAGGLKALIASKVDRKNIDDTFVLTVGKMSINPHPDNPICRRPTSSTDTGWSSVAGNIEGRQYQLTIKNIAIQTAEFGQLAIEQQDAVNSKIANENPAVKWSKTVVVPTLSPVLHPLDVDVLMAPALFISGSLVCGPAIEINFTSDCVVELNVDQLVLINSVTTKYPAQQQSTDAMELGDANCPYIMFFHKPKEDIISNTNTCPTIGEATILEDNKTGTSAFSGTGDSGMETATQSTYKSTPIKRRLSLSVDRSSNSSDYLEVFFTTGMFEISLYTTDDGSNLIKSLRRPDMDDPNKTENTTTATDTTEDKKDDNKIGKLENTEALRQMDLGRTQLRDPSKSHLARITPKSVPLLHATFHQPNLYYWKRKSQNSVQISLFNIWFGLGMGLLKDFWRSPILSTARGVIDPVTEIPPALATMKYTSGSGDGTFAPAALTQRGTLNLDVERPLLFEVSEDNVRRLMLIFKLVRTRVSRSNTTESAVETSYTPLPNKIRNIFVDNAVEVATIRTTQMGIKIAGTTVGLDSASLQMFLSSRRDQLAARALISSLMLCNDTSVYDHNLLILHPMHIGIQFTHCWEAWMRAEGGPSAREPSTRILLEMDSITIDVAPQNLIVIENILKTLKMSREILQEEVQTTLEDRSSVDNSTVDLTKPTCKSSLFSMTGLSADDHYYKDDLRSGTFKILSGEQMPMAYQAIMNRSSITWRYPHPRAIIKIVANPLPCQDNELDCILEFYSLILNHWEPYVNIKIPVSEPREIILHSQPPELIFSTIWRIRILSDNEKPPAYKFDILKYQPKDEPCWVEDINPVTNVSCESEITGVQLSGILRVDSYFGPRHTPRSKLSARFARFDLNVHNALPQIYKQASCLEGYYVSKPLMCSHRALTISAQNAIMHCRSNRLAGSVVLFSTMLAAEIMDCSTGTMEHLADDFQLQIALSVPLNDMEQSCLRLCAGKVRLALHLSRLRTLQSLTSDWHDALKQHVFESSEPLNVKDVRSQSEIVAQATRLLEGRVSLWIHNSCSVSLRMGQEDTDEVFPLGPGAKLAYRWRNPAAKKRMRFAIIKTTGDWRWSNCVTFAVGESRVRLEDNEFANRSPGTGVFIHVTVEQNGAHRLMRLSGRLVLANMLKLNLLYKVRMRMPETNAWNSICSGELGDESFGHSVICANNCEMVLKLKFENHETGWSGDIPLKECPKENVPWLVKVPSQGALPYVSVWCRVVRARSDGRIFAAVWPLYVLTSNLTLDTDVLLQTDFGRCQSSKEQEDPNPPPIIQSAPGRGARTHLLAPGTTSAKHSLSFQYRNVECPVTREAVPLHYGVTDTSVFDKRIPYNTVEEVVKEIKKWLKSSKLHGDPEWPHSIVSKHFKGEWMPALLQPRCDVTVRYHAVRVGGGGCSLEMEINPILLICNAVPISITLRAHDAAPLCKLEPATIISPPSIILKKPFFMSVEKGRETFVSQPLEVCATDPGRYGAPPQGQVALDHPALFAIPFHDEVTILSLHYEIKDEINVMGITAPFVFVNNIDIDVTIGATAVPDLSDRKKVYARAKTFSTVPASKTTSIQYIPVYQFRLYDRWRGGDISELAFYLFVSLPSHGFSIPIALGAAPYRRPLALRISENKSIPVVLTQHKHEGRWIATLSPDPCPQFLLNNKTSYSVAVAEPLKVSEEIPDAVVLATQECAGVDWWYHLHPDTSIHYSSPGYTFGEALPSEQPPPSPWLTFSYIQELDHEHVWCQPVAITAGDQRLQLAQNVFVKLHVRPHPHSTLVELRDITEEDISAKEIRKRLLLSDRMAIDQNTASNVMIHEDKEIAIKNSEHDKKKLLNKAGMIAMRNQDMEQLEKDLHEFMEQAARKEKENRLQKEIDKPSASGSKLSEQENLPSTAKKEDTISGENKTVGITTMEKDSTSGTTDTQNTDKSTSRSLPEKNAVIQNNVEKNEIAANKNNPVITPLENSNLNKNNNSTVSEVAPKSDIKNEKKETVSIKDTEKEKSVTIKENNLRNGKPSGVVSDAFSDMKSKALSPDKDTQMQTKADIKSVANEESSSKDKNSDKILADRNIVDKSIPEGTGVSIKENSLSVNTNTIDTKPIQKDQNIPVADAAIKDNISQNTNTIDTNSVPKEQNIPMADAAIKDNTLSQNTNTIDTNSVPKDHNIPMTVAAIKDNTISQNTNTIDTNSIPKDQNVPMTDTAIKDSTTSQNTNTTDTNSIPKVQNIPMTDTILTGRSLLQRRVTIDEKVVQDTEMKQKEFFDDIIAQKTDVNNYDWEENILEGLDRVKCMISSIVVEMAASCDTSPLLAIHVDRTHLSITKLNKTIKTTVTVTDVQIDNLQYESGQFDFAVIAATRAYQTEPDPWPSLWNMFTDQSAFDSRPDASRVMLKMCQDSWTVLSYNCSELSEIDVRAGPLSLYIEDAYIAALGELLRLLLPPNMTVDEDATIMAEARSLQKPLRLQLLHIQPLDLTLTLHTAVRIYIALDQSPLHLNAFKVQHMFTTTECLAHALTVHYLSAAILSAGWVVGGLELLGAPGALAARVGGATGGVRGIASTTAAALLRSLSACAGSLARNLDLLAGDEEHARRAAAARRRPPATFVGGLLAGFTNFAINILGAVGGLAHHPLVGVAVGETESSAAALRRSLLGALTKPLSATADLVAYAGHGLLTQTGWDPVPQPRSPCRQVVESYIGWRRDCVRWAFRLSDFGPIAGFEVLLQDAPVQLIVTHKFLVFAEMQCQRVVEMLDLRYCYVVPFLGSIIELYVTKSRNMSKPTEFKPVNEDDELHISEAAMQRVARYAGLDRSSVAGAGAAGASGAGEGRALSLVPAPGQAFALHALLLSLTHANADSYFPLI